MPLMPGEPDSSACVSIVMPAHNAAQTIAESIDSVIHQTYPRWELVVVDDGSIDETASIVDALSAEEPRIRRISQPRGGVSSARNLGTASARYDWLLYLDADDWLAANHLEKMTAVLAANPDFAAVHCGSVQIAPDGTRVDEPYCPSSGDMFEQFTRFCAFPVHACVFRRSLAEAVGGWDTSLLTCEDWDFWQRIARTGVCFGAVGECLALYRMRPGSASRDGLRYLIDGLRVVRQAYGPDPRVCEPAPMHAAGAPASLLPNAVFSFVCWPAGLVLGSGGDARPLLDAVDVGHDATLDYRHVAGCVLKSALLPGAYRPADWPQLWPAIEENLEAFLTALEYRSAAPGLARRTRTLMERNIIESVSSGSPLRVGRLQSIELEVTEPLEDIVFHPDVERLRCVVNVEGQRLNVIHLPVTDGTVSRAVLVDTIATEFAWIILGKFFSQTVYRELRIAPNDRECAVSRGDVCLINHLHEGDILEQVHGRAGWVVFLQELWGRPEWPMHAFYDEKFHDPGAVVRRAGSERMVIEIGEELPDLVSDGDINLDIQMGGISLGWMTVPALDRRRLRMRIIRAVGRDLFRVAIREALIGTPLAGGGTLRARLAKAASARRELSVQEDVESRPVSHRPASRAFQATAGIVLARRGLGAAGTSASQRAVFPSAVAQDLTDAAYARGDTVIRVASRDSAGRVAYAPEVICSQSAPLVPPPRVKSVAKDGAPLSQTLPILMYHRVAETSSGVTARYCISPAAFEAQLRFLRDSGAGSVTLEDWRVAWEARQPVKRSILITFDDGYRDFAETAWPLLKRFGFSALVFVVTGEVGGFNRWDVVQHGSESVPLLGWNDLRRLRDEGVEFGSHSVSHRYLTGLSQVEIIREATRSLVTLEREVGRPALAFSYPYGDVDEFVRHWIGACGYTFGVTCRSGPATHQDRLLALPRIEITGEDTLESFKEKLGF